MQTILNQLVYFGFLQSLFLLVIYLISPEKRKNINPYLLVLVGALFIGLLGRILYASEIFGKNFRLILASEISATLFGTTLYLLTKSTLQKAVSRNNLWHYTPSIIYCLCILGYFIIPKDEIIKQRLASGEAYRMVYVLHAIGLSIKVTYLTLSWLTLKKFEKNMQNEVSYTVKTSFLKKLHFVFLLVFLFWLVVYLTGLFGGTMLERSFRPGIWLSLTFVVLFIAYYGLINPSVFKIDAVTEVKKYAQSKLSVADLNTLKTDLETIMEKKKPYLNGKLLKAELAEMLGVSNPELARLLNENIGMNFFEFVNYYRVKEFIELSKTEKAKNLTFFGLAQEAGFNSKATFNNAFKRIMGSSPTVYFNNLKQ